MPHRETPLFLKKITNKQIHVQPWMRRRQPALLSVNYHVLEACTLIVGDDIVAGRIRDDGVAAAAIGFGHGIIARVAGSIFHICITLSENKCI
ncbi:MAG: hypothetical protein WCS86_02815 [Candidatus Paceibacterota bacterium]